MVMGSRRRALIGGLVLLAVATAGFGVSRWRAAGAKPIVAVVRFDNETGRPELDRLARGFLAEVHRQVEPAHAVRGVY